MSNRVFVLTALNCAVLSLSTLASTRAGAGGRARDADRRIGAELRRELPRRAARAAGRGSARPARLGGGDGNDQQYQQAQEELDNHLEGIQS